MSDPGHLHAPDCLAVGGQAAEPEAFSSPDGAVNKKIQRGHTSCGDAFFFLTSSFLTPAPPSSPSPAVAVAVAASPDTPPPGSTLLARALSWARGGAAIPTASSRGPAPPQPPSKDEAAAAAAAPPPPLARTTSTSGHPSCLICLESLAPADFADGTAITLACDCRGELALRHRACAQRWAAAKGDRVCELCRGVIANIPEPPPRPPARAAAAEEALYAPGMGVLPGGPGFGLGVSGGLVVWPPGAAALAARLPPGHPLLAALADGTLAPLPPLHESAFPPALPSGHEAVLECLRIAWVVSIVAVLFFDLNLSGALTAGLVVACCVVGAARAAAAAREAAVTAALAGWGGGERVAGMGRRQGGQQQQQQQQQEPARGVGADAV